jgi:hypothetical protein
MGPPHHFVGERPLAWSFNGADAKDRDPNVEELIHVMRADNKGISFCPAICIKFYILVHSRPPLMFELTDIFLNRCGYV